MTFDFSEHGAEIQQQATRGEERDFGIVDIGHVRQFTRRCGTRQIVDHVAKLNGLDVQLDVRM